MKTIYKGHRYELDHLDGSKVSTLQFVQRGIHPNREGVTNQEVVRAVIDRVKVLDAELHWHGNDEILWCLRRVVFLHEVRALERKQEKGELNIEDLILGADGHIKIEVTK